MKDSKLPFTTFDIFSNIVPAVIFVVGVLCLSNYSPSITNNIKEMTQIFQREPIATLTKDLPKGFTYAFIGLAVSALLFSIGHLLMAAGTLCIDRILIGRGIGYPYVLLFKLPIDNKSWTYLTKRFYLAIFSLIFIYSFILIWFPYGWLFEFFLAHLSYVIIIKLIISYKASNVSEIKEWRFRILKLINYIAFPVYVVETLLNFMRTTLRMRPFDDEFINKFKEIFKVKFLLDIDKMSDIDSSLFWLPYVYIHENNPASSQTLTFVRTLYYFSRHLCIAFYLLSVYCILAQSPDNVNGDLSKLGASCFVFSLIFFVHYYNIYFTYYSKQTFRAFYAQQRQDVQA